ncbi:hypothetical protein [Gluconobacter sp. Dm-62]|uniref:hypothetical protein n=1 Tax=Gluconobacter sp. Dm-62 TaxID=2799804 RepID=UPI002011794A|nr:hypothetical protein [Gluconobacter sp. Dm-62]
MSLLSLCGPFLATLAVLYFGLKAFYGLGTPSFGDESGHILGGLAIVKGDILYRDYIDAHGPLIFVLSWLVGLVADFRHAYLLRLIPIVCTMGSATAVFLSPVFHKWSTRFLTVAAWLAAMAAQWMLQAFNMDSYWTIGGDLLAVLMSVLVLPVLLEEHVGCWQARLGGACIALLPLTAYSFAPTAALLGLVVIAVRRPAYWAGIFDILSGAGVALGLCGLWMAVYGDLRGMIAYHFVANQFYYAPYIAVGLGSLFLSLIPSFRPDTTIQSLAVICFLVGSILMLVTSRHKLAALLCVAAVLMMQIRGAFGFQDGTFVMGALTLCVLMVMRVLQFHDRLAPAVVVAFCSLYVIGTRHAISSPYGMNRQQQHQIGFHSLRENTDVGFVKTIQKYSRPDERILVIPYNPDVYIYAGRLSMKKYHEYLPWEADYARHPWGGYERDLCHDLPRDLPPIIYFDDYHVWDRWAPADYMSCALKVLAQEYRRDPVERSVYIRRDRLGQTTFQDASPITSPPKTATENMISP